VNYLDFLADKRIVVRPAGKPIDAGEVHPSLFPFQADLVRWAVRKGRCAIFADTGLGKTRMQVEWAKHTGERCLFVAPLAVAQQTVREAAEIGVTVTYARSQKQADTAGGHTITNYEMVGKFDPSLYGAVVLDESSILKNHTGKTRTELIDMFQATPYRLACTATPAPNDVAEFANHSEFLGVMSRVDMLAAFFVHDDKGWRLKGHASQAFYRWMASWGMTVRRPSDLGYDDGPFELPELTIAPSIVHSQWAPEGQLFTAGLSGITQRTQVRKDTISERAEETARLVAEHPDEPWLIWVGLNDEQDAILERIPDAVVVQGSDSPDDKAAKLLGFQDGEHRILITKPSIAGFGLNFQHCANMVFCGVGDSYEQYYQAIRRCWRFGQTRPVTAHIVLSDPEQEIYNNVLRKEHEANTAAAAMVEHVAEYEREEIADAHADDFTYAVDDEEGDGWQFLLGDSCERLSEVEDESVGLSVFSPPFESLYTYSPSERDLGNSSSSAEFWQHFSWISDNLLRVLKPGRLAAVHVQQLPTTKAVDGVIGMRDFRGDTIRHFVDRGFIYHGEVCVDKDPQAQAIRTKAKSLMFVQLHKDSSWMRPAFADYILLFRKPGENTEPIVNDWVSNNDWIQWARPIWYGIRESDTLNVRDARSRDDERHIAPLQLETIRRAVLLWSNPGDLVLSPFGGIGSEGFVSVKENRRFVGVELKPEYHRVGASNLRRAEQERDSGTLLDWINEGEVSA
jgi:DNA modification methylase/superfamily II DNA or RNA helicase